MSASGQGVPSRLNISPSAPMQNMSMASAISNMRSRRFSGRVVSLPASLSASRTSSVLTARSASKHVLAAVRMQCLMALRSARVSRASSLSSPPVIMSLATISISPKTSRSSSPCSGIVCRCSSDPSMSSASRIVTLSGVDTRRMASVKGARLTPDPGANLSRLTVSPSFWAKSPSRPKLLPASMMNRRGL
ncbi:hypothetical protein PSTA9_04270 [Pseudomonas syringae pv. tomato]|nr:hypothetical protein PSTA9_04270 [Pseudomonas syringae pv. tomato]